MPPRIASLLIATAWMASLIVAGVVGWRIATSPSVTPRTSPRDTERPAPPDPSRAREMERLREENAGLRDALRRGQGEAQESSADRQLPVTDREADPGKIDYYLDRYFAARRDGSLVSELDDAVALALRVARAGSPGVEQMAERALGAESAEERVLSLDVLSMVADPLALKTILEYPWDELAGDLGSRDMRSWDWTMVERQLEELPSSAVTPNLERLENRLKDERAELAGQLSDEGLRACVQLALRHGSPGSVSILQQVWPELDGDAKSSVVDSLLFVETRASLDFLGEIAARDESPATRARADSARRILAEHLGKSRGR
jgi:hypothetical protein